MTSCTLMAIVRKGEAQKLMKAAREKGAPGGSVISARGTATNAILAALGLGDTSREVLLSVVEREKLDEILTAVRSVKASGIAMVIDALRGLDEEDLKMDGQYEMIQVISQDGYSEDIMAVARKAGAKGGTVINARGTSTEQDIKFFGAPLVPEKEVLMIVMEKYKDDAVKKAISSMEILRRKGMGIMFSVPVKDFINLG
ncbi:MAG: P-II family nitrogen regulator [Bullifex sp.]